MPTEDNGARPDGYNRETPARKGKNSSIKEVQITELPCFLLIILLNEGTVMMVCLSNQKKLIKDGLNLFGQYFVQGYTETCYADSAQNKVDYSDAFRFFLTGIVNVMK